MDEVALSVRHLSKAYTIAQNEEKHSTLTEAALARLKCPSRGRKKETYWALKDISFDIKTGDVVGIIGRNGAGKSTLLKIMSRITEPTEGEIDLYGRVGSLLEVGTGFHPELTGRENIFVNGAILGMKRFEVRRQFNAIVDFAEIEKFLDTPVKRYSSGMYVRLAFAVAAHLNSDILLVDEVLAVGDLDFQKRCLGKIHDLATSGRTVVFVTHHMQSVKAHCNTCIYLDGGIVQHAGDVDEAIHHYVSARASNVPVAQSRRRGSGVCRISTLNTDKSVYRPLDDIVFRAEIDSHTDDSGKYALSLVIQNQVGLSILHLDSRLLNMEFSLSDSRTIEVSVRAPRLAHGDYTVHAYLFSIAEGFDVFEQATTFTVAPILPYPAARGDCAGDALVYPDFEIEEIERVH